MEAVTTHIGVQVTMYGKKFFQKQTDATRLKTYIYEQYLGAYLIQNIAKFKKCYIMDLFCGPGKNGRNNGSPLILIDIIKNLLNIKYLQNISEVEIIFNDIDKEFICKLKSKISKTNIPSNIKIHLYSESFEEVLSKIDFEEDSYKFFFLDPFNYSSVSMNDLKNIFSLPDTEILMFIPVFHAYRFAKSNSIKGKTKKFVLSYTNTGIYNYKNIYDFVASIQEKLSKSLKTPWVREFVIRDKSRVNALFLITKDIKSVIAANEIFWNTTQNGYDISYGSLSNAGKTINSFYLSLKRKLKREMKLTNLDVIKFTTAKHFCLRHAKALFEQFKVKGKIKISELFNRTNETNLNISMECCSGRPQSILKLIK